MIYASVQGFSVTSTSFFKIDQINSWCRTTLPTIPEEKYQPIRNCKKEKIYIYSDSPLPKHSKYLSISNIYIRIIFFLNLKLYTLNFK